MNTKRDLMFQFSSVVLVLIMFFDMGLSTNQTPNGLTKKPSNFISLRFSSNQLTETDSKGGVTVFKKDSSGHWKKEGDDDSRMDMRMGGGEGLVDFDKINRNIDNLREAVEAINRQISHVLTQMVNMKVAIDSKFNAISRSKCFH